MPAQLLALDSGPSILLDKPILLLGRHPECDIQIDSRKISRRHCCIAQVSDYLVVRDLGSTNGIRINGVRVVEGRLSTGDELTIGNARYKVTWDALPAPAAPPPAGPGIPAGGTGVSPAGRAGVGGAVVGGTGVPPVVEFASARRPTIREPAPAGHSEDELLESCDEPVPLDEPPGVAPGAPPIPASPPPPAAPEEPFLLPDVLELMPNSDLFPKQTPHSSESGIHPS
jgi:hypothetical protein